MDAQVREALDKALQPEAVQRVLDKAVKEAVDLCLTEEIRAAFFGPVWAVLRSGRKLESLWKKITEKSYDKCLDSDK